MLSDQESEPPGLGKFLSQCTFWCSVLSDWTTSKTTRNSRSGLNAPSGAQCFPTLTAAEVVAEFPSQCTFWCSVLSDEARGNRRRPPLPVSMHLLVLSAFRPAKSGCNGTRTKSFNAPSGAQCFPTRLHRTGKNPAIVSMHLLVLSAFRRILQETQPPRNKPSQCTFWCSVLSDGRRSRVRCVDVGSQCTFWCSVLSDPTADDYPF